MSGLPRWTHTDDEPWAREQSPASRPPRQHAALRVIRESRPHATLDSSLVVRALQGGVHSKGGWAYCAHRCSPSIRLTVLFPFFPFWPMIFYVTPRIPIPTQSSRTPGKDSVAGGALEAHGVRQHLPLAEGQHLAAWPLQGMEPRLTAEPQGRGPEPRSRQGTGPRPALWATGGAPKDHAGCSAGVDLAATWTWQPAPRDRPTQLRPTHYGQRVPVL